MKRLSLVLATALFAALLGLLAACGETPTPTPVPTPTPTPLPPTNTDHYVDSHETHRRPRVRPAAAPPRQAILR